jgi:rhodanese-related sulfurtransferase
MRRVLLRALILVVGSIIVGLIVNAVSPRGIPYLRPPRVALAPEQRVSLAEAQELWNSGAAFFLDARAAADYAAGHIAHAYNLSAEEFDRMFTTLGGTVLPDATVIVYCDGEECDLSEEVAERLRAVGYTNVRVLVNGWTVWQQAGLAVATGSEP